MEIKNNLKSIRHTEHEMDRKDFAEHIGVKFKTYYAYEKGETNPSLLKAIEIAKKLNKHIDEIWYTD
ncbi:helix-turn-helix transcriptional regulator [Clostridium cylindrosporum]|uniref:HTH cro/C1-type domain-containing protein n=1 Tax=Clostridium cylindrosporum DSM 605 TaxID=1121307 RepID=A0A0J8D8E7_CLOCY|nr:helix-turn-helix transcriptional regulator [Clostridium cylindrosporum]KMT22330.1 hypothetical protein CLCY_16c00090 [Clostridium cylindrosporum DSM 605]